jgi:3-deoxy-D-manno-octulosonic-acid transferase
MGQRFVWIAASTHKGEDEQLLEAHTALLKQVPTALLILVPRHPERFELVAELAASTTTMERRSVVSLPSASTSVYVGDTMGEMVVLFGASSAAFVGGSLVEHGGHNVLEPAVWSIPVISGPHVHNFEAICDEMSEASALTIVHRAEELAAYLQRLSSDENFCRTKGAKAAEFLNSKRGALQSQLQQILSFL